MGQQFIVTMNPATSGKSSTRSSGYHQKALAEIRNSLLPFANIGSLGENLGSSAASTISSLSTTSGVSSASGHSGVSAASGCNGIEKDLSLLRQALVQLMNMGYTEVSQLLTFFKNVSLLAGSLLEIILAVMLKIFQIVTENVNL
jgi:serine/threonine-protein kinase LATS1/2